ncbi:MAG: TRAP transporter small permease [Peptoniphilaceae bacterium]|nr:TRAP transporter small permease [Peptoniphilaceae bacterium]MDY5766293.1 TRAP transporter small permease [Peptoniphilaceae bacterium]MDY5841793.1 TRAP transporter small permease [Peptoniphilaceae bacterium]
MTKVLNKLRQFTNAIVILFFALVVIVVSIQVFARFVLGTSIRWADEFSRFAFVWVIYLGGAITIRDGRNVCFDLILEAQKGFVWKIMYTAVFLLSSLFLVLITYFGILVCMSLMSETSPIMQLPMSVVSLCIPIGGVLMLIEEISLYVMHKDDRTKSGQEEQ